MLVGSLLSCLSARHSTIEIQRRERNWSRRGGAAVVGSSHLQNMPVSALASFVLVQAHLTVCNHLWGRAVGLSNDPGGPYVLTRPMLWPRRRTPLARPHPLYARAPQMVERAR